MAKIQPVWALDIGQAALKALKLVPGGEPGHVLAEAFDFVEYPKILSQPDADPETLVKEALQTFLERNDLKGCKVAIAVAGQAGLVKFIKLPPVEKKRIPDIVKFEARQQIPFALEEVIWDYQQIGGDDEGDEGFSMAEVGLFAMKRDQIARALFPFQAANIEVDLVQMGPIALYNFGNFDFIKPEDKEKGSIVLLDIGADNTDLIITDGVRIWQRNVPIGGNHFTRALTKELKLTFAKAEHLKRNATKAPDPRAVFTAMRGIFNDFASEVNRSIGFYSSVNRTAKIAKVVGLGNGFKLPGLQKFLQQNLSYEVEKLEGFEKLTGDEVKGAPQFQENMPSFAVAYGLAVQGLGLAKLHTNLLPPEVERVRMIRRKKPWAAAAAALVAIGVVAMAASDYRALAKVSSPEYKSAVEQAKSTSQAAAKLKTEFEAAKGDWERTLGEGNALMPQETEETSMGMFLRTLQEALILDPTIDPRNGHRLNPDNLQDRALMDRIRVHIDAIRPVWEPDLGKWFDGLTRQSKDVMHPYDRTNKPSGEGWVVQVVGHHFNPSPQAGGKGGEEKMPGIDMGPVPYLIERIIPRVGAARFRRFGLNHATFSWILIDRSWTNEKAAGASLPANVPILARNTVSKAASGPGSPGGPSGSGGPTSSQSYAAFMAGSAARSMPPPPSNDGGMGAYMSGQRPLGGVGTGPDGKKALQTRTRTDFKLELIWKPEEKPKTIEEIEKAMDEAKKTTKGVAAPPSEADFDAISKQATLKALEESRTPAPGTTPPGVAPAPGVPPGAAPMPR